MICMEEKHIQALRNYVGDSSPKVNDILRIGIESSEVKELESLFVPKEKPIRVFWGVSISDLKIKDGIYCDPAFVSTISSAEKHCDISLNQTGFFLLLICLKIRW